LDELPRPGAGNKHSRCITREMNGFNSTGRSTTFKFYEITRRDMIIIE
jgi:hypothetical protein